MNSLDIVERPWNTPVSNEIRKNLRERYYRISNEKRRFTDSSTYVVDPRIKAIYNEEVQVPIKELLDLISRQEIDDDGVLERYLEYCRSLTVDGNLRVHKSTTDAFMTTIQDHIGLYFDASLKMNRDSFQALREEKLKRAEDLYMAGDRGESLDPSTLSDEQSSYYKEFCKSKTDPNRKQHEVYFAYKLGILNDDDMYLHNNLYSDLLLLADFINCLISVE